MNFVVTALNEKFWNPWGLSWALSLRKIAQPKADVVVLNHGLSLRSKSILESLDISVLDGASHGTLRQSALLQSAKNAVKGGDKVVYFDADIWFQKNFDEIFDEIDDSRLRLSSNFNQGFMAGNSRAWSNYTDIHAICQGTKESRVYEALVNFFQGFFDTTNHRYNCPNVHQLVDVDGTLTHMGMPVAGIHFTGPLKTLGLKKNVTFQERHSDLFGDYINSYRTRHIYLGKPSHLKS